MQELFNILFCALLFEVCKLSEQTVHSSREDCMPHMLYMLFDHSHILVTACILLAWLQPVVHIFSATTKAAPCRIIDPPDEQPCLDTSRPLSAF